MGGSDMMEAAALGKCTIFGPHAFNFKQAVEDLLKANDIRCDLTDERFAGAALDVTFAGILRTDQEAAVVAMLRHDAGVLCAPTAFGKTVTAAASPDRRARSTSQ